MLLSATITPAALSTLRALFGTDPDGNSTPFGLCGGVRLRPEIELWPTAASTAAEQEERVLEALRHLPRPAILYVTRVQSAEDWLARTSQRILAPRLRHRKYRVHQSSYRD